MKWMKFWWLYFIISALIIIPGIFSLIRFGLKPSIDFTGGAILEYRFNNNFDSKKISEILSGEKISFNSIQISGQNTYLLRLPPADNNQAAAIKSALTKGLGETPQEIRFETVGPILGKELIQKTIIAIILAAGFIMAYVGYQFKNFKFGLCAILAMFHDSLVMLGSFSLLGYFCGIEVDTLFVTAVLTILSFSVHDTVVVYDRIRESQRILPSTDFEEIVDRAITETLPRSLNNSLTIIFMLLALLLLGGDTTRWFVLALLIGTISGTYSSTFNAAPLLVIWEKISTKRNKSLK